MRMRNLCTVCLGLALCFVSLAYAAFGGTVAGTVKDSTGASVKGAFVQARNPQSNITVSVLSNRQGSYRIDDLAPGDYEVKVMARGYKGESRPGVKVADGNAVPLDFTVQTDRVRWSDLSLYEHKTLLPEGKGKADLFGGCIACHGISTKFGRRSEEGWTTAVNYMNNLVGYFLGDRFSGQRGKDLIAYLNRVYGEESELPRYPDVKPREFSDEAMKLVYVDYEVPTSKAFPWSAFPAKDGSIWIPQYNSNKVGKLDPKTGKIEEFRVPETGPAHIHSAVAGPDGTVWATESSGVHKLARLDPKTKEWKEFQDPATASTRGTMQGRRHTALVGPDGNIWSSGDPVTRLDPKTGEFMRYPTGGTYGMSLDQAGNVWFTQLGESKLGKIDVKTGKVTKWDPPTPDSGTRRMQIDKDGMVWIAEFRGGKIARFDPQTETFKEYPLPGPEPTPYAFLMDSEGYVWYSSYMHDVLGRLDPRTGDVVLYPMPYVDNLMRELFLDDQKRLWYGTGGFNKVGYFSIKQ